MNKIDNFSGTAVKFVTYIYGCYGYYYNKKASKSLHLGVKKKVDLTTLSKTILWNWKKYTFINNLDYFEKIVVGD